MFKPGGKIFLNFFDPIISILKNKSAKSKPPHNSPGHGVILWGRIPRCKATTFPLPTPPKGDASNSPGNPFSQSKIFYAQIQPFFFKLCSQSSPTCTSPFPPPRALVPIFKKFSIKIGIPRNPPKTKILNRLGGFPNLNDSPLLGGPPLPRRWRQKTYFETKNYIYPTWHKGMLPSFF